MEKFVNLMNSLIVPSFLALQLSEGDVFKRRPHFIQCNRLFNGKL